MGAAVSRLRTATIERGKGDSLTTLAFPQRLIDRNDGGACQDWKPESHQHQCAVGQRIDDQ